jgi:acetyltransferase-like isoleucine patch superfamily enzyme
MQIRPIEQIIISFVLLAVATISVLITALIVPVSKKLLMEYHVLADAIILLSIYVLLTSLTVRILLKISPLEAERYGFEHFNMISTKAVYWKLITSVTYLGGMYFQPFVPLFLRPHYYALFGAKIGKNVEIAGTLSELPLITVEDNAFIGGDTFITAHAVVHDFIILKPVKIGRNATIGVGAIIMPGVDVGEYSIVAPGSVVEMDTIIPPNEFWSGIPAKRERALKFSRSSDVKA